VNDVDKVTELKRLCVWV